MDTMDHQTGVILWWALGFPAIIALIWLTVSILRKRK